MMPIATPGPRGGPAAPQAGAAGAACGWPDWLARIGLAAGIALQLRQYLHGRSLWIDEANLANNILARPVAGLFGTLDGDQAAPPGFLLAVKLATRLFGTSEWALRLIPCVAGVAALVALYALARRWWKPWTVALAMALAAVNWNWIRYGNECKQYATDALAALVVLHAADAFARGRLRAPTFALLGALLVWCSHPAILMLAAAGTTLLTTCWRSRPRPAIVALALCGAAWLASFAAVYLLTVVPVRANAYLQGYWAAGYLPHPWQWETTWAWLQHAAREWAMLTVREAGGNDLLARTSRALILLAGIASMASLCIGRRRLPALLLLATVGVTLAAAALQAYPFSGRLLVFLVPCSILLVAAGMEWMLLGRGRAAGAVWALLAVLLLARPAAAQYGAFLHPALCEEMRPLVEHLLSARQPGEPVYVYVAAAPAFRYYLARAGVEPDDDMHIGTVQRAQSDAFRAELAGLTGQARVWILVAHNRGQDERRLTAALDTLGTCRDRRREVGATLYTYDLTPASDPPGP